MPFDVRDASNYAGRADRILRPSREEEVARILAQANKNRIPLTVCGARTGLTGAGVPKGGILLSTKRMNRILMIHWDRQRQEGFVRLQAGVTLKQLEQSLEKRGLFYPPNPGEKAAFVGGTVATNASGSRSFLYGSTRRYVRRLRIVLANGELLQISRGQKASIPLPTYKMPNVKNAAGYYAHPRMDLVDLFIGSEGTLGVFTEIELAVLRRPPAVVGGLFFFSSEEVAYRFARSVRAMGRKHAPAVHPRVLEFFDSPSLRLLAPKHPGIPAESGGAIYFEQECSKVESGSLEKRWRAVAKNFGAAAEGWLFRDPKGQRFLRKFRYDLPVLVNQASARNGFRKTGTDMAVPESKGAAMFDFYLKRLRGCGMDYALFGHVGQEHLHANFLPKTRQEFERSKALYFAFAKKAIALGGTVSAEHGIGKVRIPYLKLMIGIKGLREMARIKKSLDPNGILNPGTLIPLELLEKG